MAIYLHLEGIEGDVQAANHEGWIECSSIQWGVARSIDTPVGSGASRKPSAPSISEVTLTKIMDRCSPKLFVEACVGKSKTAKIDLIETGSTQLETYMTYELSNALVSSYSMSSGGEVPTEVIAVNFTVLECVYTPYDDHHKAQAPVRAGYDVSTGKAL